jgi:hypothetical protein
MFSEISLFGDGVCQSGFAPTRSVERTFVIRGPMGKGLRRIAARGGSKNPEYLRAADHYPRRVIGGYICPKGPLISVGVRSRRSWSLSKGESMRSWPNGGEFCFSGHREFSSQMVSMMCDRKSLRIHGTILFIQGRTYRVTPMILIAMLHILWKHGRITPLITWPFPQIASHVDSAP